MLLKIAYLSQKKVAHCLLPKMIYVVVVKNYYYKPFFSRRLFKTSTLARFSHI